MATLQRQAKAMGDPTRYAVYQLVSEADFPIGVTDITEHFDLHPNAIRQHLGQLVEAELVIEATAPPQGRGRPRLVYEADPTAALRWGSEGPYQALSEMLAEVIASGRTPVEVGRDAAPGMRVPSPSGDLVADVAAAMARQGFDPDVHATDGGAEIVLRRCPFSSVAESAPDTVCAIHLGIAQGLVDGADAVVTELVAKDPRTAGCRLSIQVGTDSSQHNATAALSMTGAPRDTTRPSTQIVSRS